MARPEYRRPARQAFLSVNSYWHELFFFFAACVLVLGLLIESWAAQRAERLAALLMLAIVLYSLFAGGLGWMPPAG